MTKRNLCDTCLHCHVCRHSTDPAGTAMVSCVCNDFCKYEENTDEQS